MNRVKVRTSRPPDFSGLNQVQRDHVMRTYPETRASMAEYLRQGVAVFIYRQDEVPDVPPFAIAVSKSPGYWIDCVESEAAARSLASDLGLSVSSE